MAKLGIDLGTSNSAAALVFDVDEQTPHTVEPIEGDYFEALFSVLVAILFIALQLEYKQLYNLHSKARDIINYYRNREHK